MSDSPGPQENQGPAPVAVFREDGIHPGVERRWGIIGAVIGGLAGLGSVVASLATDASSRSVSSGPWPQFMESRRLLVFDIYVLMLAVVGMACLIIGLVASRRSAWPRSSVFGPVLVGTVLVAMAIAFFIIRMWASAWQF